MDPMSTKVELTNCPAQTCIALGAKYNYGKQGLPDLPTRLHQHTNISTRSATTGSDSGRRKIATTSNASLNLQKRDLFPSSYHPYNDKILPASTLLDLTTKRRSLPATSRTGHESTASSNSTSSTLLANSSKSKQSKKVIVIKKKCKSYKRTKSPLVCHELNLSVVGKWDALPAAEKGQVLVESSEYQNNFADFRSDLKHCPSPASHPPKFASTANLRDNNGQFEANEGTLGENDNATKECEDGNYSRMISSSRPTTESVKCIALPLLKQRLGYLWDRKMFTDVIFFVGRNHQKIEAHRVILASCSEVFQSLLYSEGKPLQNSDEKYILYENDFSESAFEAFIKAMYTNEIPICLTLAIALEVFYATKKYAVLFLEDQVLEHIRQLLTVSNVFEAMRFSTNAVELTYLAPICWRIVEENTAEVLEYHLEHLEPHLFARVLERDRLSIDESELFQYAIRWAAHLCKTNGMKTTGKNKRRFMEPLLKHFRFTTMSPLQFSEIVAPSRILESREIKQIQSVFHKVIDLKNMVMPYKSTPRVNTAVSANDNNSSSAAQLDSITRFGSATKICPMDGSGDGVQLQMIHSDSAVTGSKVHSGKKGASSTKLRLKRVSSSRTTKLVN